MYPKNLIFYHLGVLFVLSAQSGAVQYARSIGTKVGEKCRFVTFPDLGSEPWLIEIGNHVELSGNVTFITHDGATWLFRDEEKYKNVLKFGKIIIHDNCFIGMGTHILPGIEIGPNSIIGAGSVVTKSIPENSIYAGNPAHFICKLDDYKKKCLESCVEYDIDEYKINKKEVILKMLEGNMKLL